MKVLGIETSCDDTAVAIVDDKKNILSNVALSQIKEHEPYGGVVPEIAARAHIDALDSLIKKALLDANIKNLKELDAIAVTAGPGLIGGVIVGVMTAKAIASAANIPIIAVNHLEGHALTARLVEDIEFPFMLLLVSGGHCQILSVLGVGQYEKLGSTMDDALGEAFDKVAKMLGLGYPGGPVVEKLAKLGNAKRFDFPRSMIGREGCDFSFSGLKTAVKREVDKIDNITDQDKNDFCASFQACIGDILEDRVKNALRIFKQKYPNAKTLVIAGGVAANQYIKARLQEITKKFDMQIATPPIKLCTDNGAMIAWAGIEKLKLGHKDDLSFLPRARWRLEV